MAGHHRHPEQHSRRTFIAALATFSGAALLGDAGWAQGQPATAGPADPKLIEDLVAANRILAAEGVVDGYGHISVRHNKAAGRYLLARSVAPELVTGEDILEFDLDSNPVGARGKKLYLERFIHGEIYKARPDVKSVVHHHSPAVVPFSVSSFALRPVYHMSAFIAEGVPVFEIRDAGGTTDMLVRTPELGRALARTLSDKPALLMRGHGAVVVGSSLVQSVGRSVYLQMNARLQAQAIALGGEVNYLTLEEARKIEASFGYDRAWELWKHKAMVR